MKTYFDTVKNNFGFGCMRLPMKGLRVDCKQFSEMVDEFIAAGFTYFDTAHGYINGKSERAIKACLTSRYPREAYTLTNKLTTDYFKKKEDIRPFFMKQLEWCGVSYFDFYLMHAQCAEFYSKYKRCDAYAEAFRLKEEGYVKHVGLSFHDKADVLDMILTENPDIEVVQIQFNYADYDDVGVAGGKCYEVCRKHNKPIIVMEPVRGGSLATFPAGAETVVEGLKGASPASYAIRYAASFEGIMMVLSGMSNLAQLRENVGFMKEFKPLDDKEFAALNQVAELFRAQGLIPCTACRYCTEGCPKQIAIPDLFACMNAKKTFHNWNSDWYYSLYAKEGSKASDCIQCGKCEKTCPQHLKIRDLLKDVAKEFKR